MLYTTIGIGYWYR